MRPAFGRLPWFALFLRLERRLLPFFAMEDPFSCRQYRHHSVAASQRGLQPAMVSF